ncbi:uncharacterized protein [Palaemon carinicauda]|uniref:uncharacterized protein n=1 Tax=Palaemon carinicauda TaxID=392227 RepID=UPI0035B6ABA5
MVKLLLFPFALILAFASAQADDKFYISDANNPVNFIATASSHTFLASWTSDINNEIIMQVFVNSRNNRQRLFEYIYNSSESNAWNIIEIYRNFLAVIINPGNRTYVVFMSNDLKITIKSTKKTYWRFCANIYQCDLPAPVYPAAEFSVGSTTTQSSTRNSALNFTSMVLLSICCLLVAIVIGMAVYIIRGRRASLNESGSNMKTEAIYVDVQVPGNVSRAQQNHDFENVIYGAVIPRQA